MKHRLFSNATSCVFFSAMSGSFFYFMLRSNNAFDGMMFGLSTMMALWDLSDWIKEDQP